MTLSKKKKVEENQELLSQQEVWDTLAFARNYLSGMMSYGNPFLLNDSLKNISFNPIGGQRPN